MCTCQVCNEAITNPVCSNCLQNEITHWMEDFQAGDSESVKNVTTLFSHFKTGVKCIICKEELNVCAHCYCKEAKIHVNEKSNDDFVRAFDFQLIDLNLSLY